MFQQQSLLRLTRNLKNIAHLAARRKHLAFLPPFLLVLLVSACSTPAATPAAQPPAATNAPAAQPPAVTNAPAAISTPNAPATTQPPASSSVLSADPRAAVEYALRTQPKSLPFKVDMTIGSGSNQINTSTVIETPTRIMITQPKRSVIWADGKCYEMATGAAWQTCANPATGKTVQAGVNALLDSATIEQGISIIKTVKLVGSETLNGIDTQVYEYTISGEMMGMQVDGTTRLWVDVKNGLPVKSVMNSTVSSITSTSTQLITYDPSLKVVTP